jgi:hypothetical protein
VSPHLAYWIIVLIAAYLSIGLVVAVLVVVGGLRRLDPVAAHGTWGFRLLILPGLTALWPFVLRRVVMGAGHPPEESNAHRRTARQAPRPR